MGARDGDDGRTNEARWVALAALVLANGCVLRPNERVGETPHSEVGIVVVEPTPDRPLQCTGTLVGARTVLTAAHCVTTGACRGQFVQWHPPTGVLRGETFHRCAAKTVPRLGLPSPDDVAIVHLDAVAVDPSATARLSSEREIQGPNELVAFGHGGRFCLDDGLRARTLPLPSRGVPTMPFACPGNSGAPLFDTGSAEIVAIVSGNFLVAVVAPIEPARAWIRRRIEESERGLPFATP